MGRKRKNPQVVFLRVFTEDEKLTEEQKVWLLSKRTKGDFKNGMELRQRRR